MNGLCGMRLARRTSSRTRSQASTDATCGSAVQGLVEEAFEGNVTCHRRGHHFPLQIAPFVTYPGKTYPDGSREIEGMLKDMLDYLSAPDVLNFKSVFSSLRITRI